MAASTLPAVEANGADAPAATGAGDASLEEGTPTRTKSARANVATAVAARALRTAVTGATTRETGTTSPMRLTVPATGVAGTSERRATMRARLIAPEATGPRALRPVVVPPTMATLLNRTPAAAESRTVT